MARQNNLIWVKTELILKPLGEWCEIHNLSFYKLTPQPEGTNHTLVPSELIAESKATSTTLYLLPPEDARTTLK